MPRTLLPTTQSAVTRPIEMLACHVRLWLSNYLRRSTDLFSGIHLDGEKEGGEEARKTSCNLQQTGRL